MKLSYISLVILFHRNNAFSSSSIKTNTRCAQSKKCHQLSLLQTIPLIATTTHTTVGSISSRIETRLYDSEPDSGVGGDGWFDDYDDFVGKLDFEGGGWDSGADSPFDGDGRSSSDGSRGRGGGRGRGRGGGGRGRGMTWDRDFSGGSNGHDYARDTSRDAAPVDEAAVDRLLSDRLHYRKKRMFDAADDMRDELLNVHGVTVWDKDRTWTTGRGGADTRGGRGGGGRGRGRGRGDRFDRAGRGSGRGRGRQRELNEFGHDYTNVGPVDPTFCTLAEEEIHDMIRERMECKMARDFQTADSIQAQLEGAGVDVHDGMKEWRADGQQWMRSQRNFDERPSRESRGPKTYHQRGPGKTLSAEQIETITALVAERSECKAVADYNRADEIFDQLSNEYNVNVDDKRAEWALLTEEYLLNEADSSFVPDDDVQMKIGKLLGDRILARKCRDFDKADDIRDELREDYMVEIDDRSKDWVVVAPEGARWADDDEEGDVDVVSKQEWDEEDDEDSDEADDDADIDAFMEEVLGSGEDEVAGDEGKSASSFNEASLMEMTVPELKEILKSKGLKVGGKKAELVERLLN